MLVDIRIVAHGSNLLFPALCQNRLAWDDQTFPPSISCDEAMESLHFRFCFYEIHETALEAQELYPTAVIEDDGAGFCSSAFPPLNAVFGMRTESGNEPFFSF